MANFTILEPMSTGDVIDRTVRLYRRNFTPMVAVVAIPTLIGYISSMLFWFGYMKMLPDMESTAPPEFEGAALLMLGLGIIGYPLWFFSLVVTISALSRVVSDHIMLGEPVTIRKCLSAIRRRLGDITLMGLLSIALMVGLGIAFYFVIVLIVLIAALIVGATTGLGLPTWVITVIVVVTILMDVAAGIYLMLQVMARLVFLPQIVMIEGQSVGSALGRAMSLGSGNWYRVGAIMLFTYFVSLSLLAAFTFPFLGILAYFNILSAAFFSGSTWNVVSSAFNQISNLLVLPLWIVSFTLLYFDSRVRKEAYDLELLAREVSPGFYLQPVARPPAFAYYPQPGFVYPRTYVQTSPLGLAGYMPPAASPPAPQPQQAGFPQGPVTQSQQQGYQNIVAAVDTTSPSGRPTHSELELNAEAQTTGQQAPNVTNAPAINEPAVDRVSALCWNCGSALQTGAQFCIQCGKRVAAT